MVTGAATRRPPQPDNGHPPNFNVTPQGFKNLLETREALVKEDPSTVFAIQCTSGNRQELVAEYERVNILETLVKLLGMQDFEVRR